MSKSNAKEYEVVITFPLFVIVKVKADSEEEAEAMALDEVRVSNYAGNGGVNKLIGVDKPNQSVEVGDEPFFEYPYAPRVDDV